MRAVFVFGEDSLATEATVPKDHQTISDHLASSLFTFVHMWAHGKYKAAGQCEFDGGGPDSMTREELETAAYYFKVTYV